MNFSGPGEAGGVVVPRSGNVIVSETRGRLGYDGGNPRSRLNSAGIHHIISAGGPSCRGEPGRGGSSAILGRLGCSFVAAGLSPRVPRRSN